MKRFERMFRNTMRGFLPRLYNPDEDKAKLKQEFQVWVGLRFALKKQQNVEMMSKEIE